jgi:hypothetical protein
MYPVIYTLKSNQGILIYKYSLFTSKKWDKKLFIFINLNSIAKNLYYNINFIFIQIKSFKGVILIKMRRIILLYNKTNNNHYKILRIHLKICKE